MKIEAKGAVLEIMKMMGTIVNEYREAGLGEGIHMEILSKTATSMVIEILKKEGHEFEIGCAIGLEHNDDGFFVEWGEEVEAEIEASAKVGGDGDFSRIESGEFSQRIPATGRVLDVVKKMIVTESIKEKMDIPDFVTNIGTKLLIEALEEQGHKTPDSGELAIGNDEDGYFVYLKEAGQEESDINAATREKIMEEIEAEEQTLQ